jgi:hypothetical protein
MAWIKFEKDLPGDPRVLRMAKTLCRSGTCNAEALQGSGWAVTLVCGALVRLWCLADSHVGEDDILDLSAADVDEFLGLPGFCELMPADWLIADGDRVKLPGFHAHNGTAAKKRAVTQKRVSRHRSRNAESVTRPRPRPRPDPDQKKETLSAAPTAGEPDLVEEVFNHWRTTHGHERAQLDPKRRKVIRAALENYSASDLCRAITGYLHSPHHMGQNDRGTRYDDIELFLRDAKHIDAGLRFADSPPRTDQSALTRRNVAAVENWMPPELRGANGTR